MLLRLEEVQLKTSSFEMLPIVGLGDTRPFLNVKQAGVSVDGIAVS
jgi:hypothetical protein